jgi:coenzyme F420 hydrogenase subunit beta
MKSSVIIDIVNKDLCIGCGICAALCPEGNLTLQWNQSGEYNPSEGVPCTVQCGVCLMVCPFADGNNNEDAIGKMLYGNIPGVCHQSETGYYLDCYVGFAPETRNRGSSGGMATWLLSTLLKKGIVDYVIVVLPHEDPDQLFKFAILSDPESVLDSSGSAYYPVELSGVIREILNKPGKYAIIGLPCFVKGIRLALEKNKKLRERIILVLGMVCGQLKSKHYTHYISSLCGVYPPLRKVYYRGKNQEKPAINYYFSCMNTKGDSGKIFLQEGVGEVWGNRWFTPNACNYCDDVFAECADITFMDAWLPEYYSDPRGTTLLLVRSARIQNIITEGIKSEEIHLNRIPVEKVIESQKGGIAEKRIHLSYRLHLAHSRGIPSPEKRVGRKKIRNPFLRADIELKAGMQRVSRQYFTAMSGHDADDMVRFQKLMNRYLQKARLLRRASEAISVPSNVLRYVRRHIHGLKTAIE